MVINGSLQGSRIDFESGGGGTKKLHQFFGLGYISCKLKNFISEKSGGVAPAITY